MHALKRVFDIRPGEGRRAALAFCSLMLVIAAYTMVKAVRDALFLSKFGITQLSLMAIGLALATGFIISIYLRGTSGLSRNRLIWGTNMVIASSLIAIRVGLLSSGLASLLPWVLYIWSSIFGVFIVMQFWLLANDLFDPREAKRLFGFVGAGAITGGVVGGFVSRSLAAAIGASNLLVVAAVMLIIEAVLVSLVWPHRRQDPKGPPSRKGGDESKSTGGFSTLKENRSVRLLAGALLLSVLATTLLDWQFKGIVKAAYAGRTDEMAGFFGALYGWLSVGSFVVQTFVTGAVLRRFGVGVGLLALPVSLLFGSVLILGHGWIPMMSLLVAASTAKVAEGGLRFSLDKASMELMWLPVPPDIKERGKSFVDTVVDRLGTGLTGFIWLALAALGWDTPERIHWISLAVIGTLVVWLVVLLGARGAYRGALRDILTRRSREQLDPETMNLMDAEARRMVGDGLEQKDAQEVLFSLYLLERWDGPLPDLGPLLGHEDEHVRLATLELLTRRGEAGTLRRAALPCLADPSESVREAAIVYMHTTAPSGRDMVLEQAVMTGGIPPEVMDVIQLGSPDHAVSAAGQIKAALEREDLAEVAALVRLLAGAPPEMAAALLAAPLEDRRPEVVRAALHAAGRAGAAQLVDQICSKLERPGLHIDAAKTLTRLGPAAVSSLEALAARQDAGDRARLRALQLLGRNGGQESAPLLLELLEGQNPDVALRSLRALNRLRSRDQLDLTEEQAAVITRRLSDTVEWMHEDLLDLKRGSWADLRGVADDGEDLMAQTLAERVGARMDQAFRLLALLYDPAEVYDSYLGVRSPLKAIRASSAEFLDNMLDKAHSERLLPLLEEQGAGGMEAIARRVTGREPENRTDLLSRLRRESDPTVAAVAAWIQNGEERDATMGMTTIEKAMKLQGVDVLQRASMEDLMHIAQITEEIEVQDAESIYDVGDAPDALFVVTSGAVRLHRDDTDIALLKEGESFGSWALVDEAPRVAAATAVEATTLLKVKREDFVELLADRVDIVQAVFKAMVERLRNLAELADSLDDGVE